MMRTYLAAGALGASLFGLGIAGAPIASAHETPRGPDVAAHDQRGVRDTRDADGGRRGDPRDVRPAAGDTDPGRDGRGCDHDGRNGIEPAPGAVAPADDATPPSTPAVDPTEVSSDEGTPTTDDRAEGRRHDPWQILATTLGMSGDEIRAALRSGQSIDDLAVARGIDPAVVDDALTQPFDSRLDQLVAEGRLTQAQADQVKARFDAFVAYLTSIHLTPEAAAQPAA